MIKKDVCNKYFSATHTSSHLIFRWKMELFIPFCSSRNWDLYMVIISAQSDKVHEEWSWDWHLRVQFSRSVVTDSLQPHGLQHARLPCPSPTPRACSNSCPSSRWCHPTISFSVVPFSYHLQSFPASSSSLMNQFLWAFLSMSKCFLIS